MPRGADERDRLPRLRALLRLAPQHARRHGLVAAPRARLCRRRVAHWPGSGSGVHSVGGGRRKETEHGNGARPQYQRAHAHGCLLAAYGVFYGLLLYMGLGVAGLCSGAWWGRGGGGDIMGHGKIHSVSVFCRARKERPWPCGLQVYI